ncbi:hypothetical protein [Dyella kyungheensis]|uniref:Uncharacterized protein n=1 Tax=Dyella kyungheensis TaxID=1242174 RepID=A0ABS2JR98_9GAMM|nr:hypothetical protein [Dyella kyungheensis]MBM7121381.1 hypothetical protein [Dyella kyungheensis]
MAAPDHTARIRPSFPMDGALAAPLDRLRVADGAQFTLHPLAPREGIAQVADTLARLLADSESCLRAQHLGWPTEPARWPFGAIYAESIGAAVHYLRQYAGMLGRELE